MNEDLEIDGDSLESAAEDAAAPEDAATGEEVDTAEEGETGEVPAGAARDEEEEEREPPSPEEVATTAEGFVAGLIEAMGLEAEVTSSTEGDSAYIDVSGEGLGALIGRRGQTLDSLQEITRTAVQRRLRARVRLLVDVEGYRARRRASLADYARSMAERAKERGTEIELEPMTSFERKVVHDAVAEVDGATSFSEGEEPNRKVIVRGL
jgi:spoIIIJ-associated protein